MMKKARLERAFLFYACSMIRTISFFYVIVLLSVYPLSSQTLVPYRHIENWGFANESGGMIIPARFNERPTFFKKGYAIVKDSLGAYLINRKNRSWGQGLYDAIEWESDNRLRIKNAGLFGLFLTKRVIFSVHYSETQALADGFNMAKDSLNRIIVLDKGQRIIISSDSTISELVSFTEGIFVVERNRKYGTIDRRGAWIVKPLYDYIWPYSEGLAAAAIERDSLYVYLDKRGKVRLKGNVPLFSPFKNGLAHVYANGVFGAIDKKGNIIIPYQFNAIGTFKDGWALVERGNTFNYVNVRGQMLLESFVVNATEFSEGRAAIANAEEKWAIIDTKGKVLSGFDYDFIEPIREGMARVYIAGGSGFINASGKLVIPATYDTEKPSNDYQAGDASGIQFNEGMAVVSRYGKYGYIDKKGKEVIKLKYEEAQPFKKGYALVKWNGKYGYINKSGKEFFND